MALSSGGRKAAAFCLAEREFSRQPYRVEKNVRGKTQEDRDLIDMLDPVAETLGYEIVRLRLESSA